MKQLICEMCDSANVVKQEGLFVCQTCGCRYSVEEARKMMMDDVSYSSASGQRENIAETERLYQAARNARETSDDETALQHYATISAQDPNSWEALFYLTVLKTNSIKNGQIKSAAISVQNCLEKVFLLVREYVDDEEERKAAVQEIVEQCCETSAWLARASYNYYKTSTQGNGLMALSGLSGLFSSVSSTNSEFSEHLNRCFEAANIVSHCGNLIEKLFNMDDDDYCSMAVVAWSHMMKIHVEFQNISTGLNKGTGIYNPETVDRFTAKINQYSRRALKDTDLAVLTVCFDSTGWAVEQVQYKIDGGEKEILNRKEKKQHFLKRGEHVLSIVTPLMKKEHSFKLESSKTIELYGTAWEIKIN